MPFSLSSSRSTIPLNCGHRDRATLRTSHRNLMSCFCKSARKSPKECRPWPMV
jgi:hypothetical protein